MLTLAEITGLLKAHLPEMKMRYPIDEIALFGSYARGEATEESDVDILVNYQGTDAWNFLDLHEELENMLGKKVDILTKRAVRTKFWELIQNELVYV